MRVSKYFDNYAALDVKIIVLGDVGVGKTTTILVLKTGRRDDGNG